MPGRPESEIPGYGGFQAFRAFTSRMTSVRISVMESMA